MFEPRRPTPAGFNRNPPSAATRTLPVTDLALSDMAALAAPHAAGLCDPCLGRLFARAPDGRTNAGRGAELRRGAPGPSTDDCGLCEGLLGRVDLWVRLCLAEGAPFEHETFLVGTVHFDSIRTREEALWASLLEADGGRLAATVPPRPNSPPWPLGEWLKTEINREVGKRIEAATKKRVDLARPDITYRVDTRLDHVQVQVADLFVRGRYRKFVRDLPQTRWPCRACGGLGCRQCGGSGATYETSVEQLVAAPFLAASGAEGEAFHGMGREDIDARTLGNGRPFILELKRPRRRALPWRDLEAAVNVGNPGRVEIEGIGPAGPESAAEYKAADPDKSYRAACKAAAPIGRGALEAALQALEGVELEQRTPQRVSHRRADLVRRRRIQKLRLLSDAGEDFLIEIRADSGTYIKEFVSGDEGRTQPSLAGRLGIPCTVAELDVVAVHYPETAPSGASPAPPTA